MELHMYSICAYLSSDFLKVVEKAFFLGNGYGALFLTSEERLYTIGRIFSCTLGVGRHFVPKELMKVPFPKNEKILDFATRGMYCVALSKDGAAFHWGGSLSTPHHVYCLRDLCVVQIGCGEDFLMALCTNGKVWAWKGRKFASYQICPRDEDMVEADYSPNIIKMVGIFRPILLTKSGKIYFPVKPFLTTVSPINFLTKPFEELPPGDKIVKLVCGKFRIYTLSEKGALYSWNEYSCSNTLTPELITCDLGRVCDIRAPLDSDELIAANSTGRLFKISRGYGGRNLWVSIKLKNSSFNEYEAASNSSCYGIKELLDTPVEASDESKLSRVKWLRKWMEAFNNPEDSDVTFVVEGKMIYAHQMLLSLQCQQLKRAFDNAYKDELNRILMPIENVSHSTFYRFIKFLYYGQLDIGSAKGNIELLRLVHVYEYEPLMNLCEEIVIRGLQVNNACLLNHLASHLGLKELKDRSLDFIREHRDDMIKHGYAGEVAGILCIEGDEATLTE